MASPTNPKRSLISPLPIDRVTIEDEFWAPRIEQVRTRTLPQQEHQLRTGGQFEALALTWRPGDPGEPHIFWESDVAKWIEAASYSLAKHPDESLETAVDEAISLLAGAQQADGYLNVYYTVVRPGERFTDLRDGHELYCAGHLMEAAAAHYAATGKTSLLEIVRRYGDLLLDQFGPGGPLEGGYDGHQEIELGLIRLSSASGDPRYAELAQKMIDDRGTEPFYFEREEERRGTPGYFGFHFPQRGAQPERFREYNQSHAPVRKQRDAVGHCVRAMYMYSAMTELAQASAEPGLVEALKHLWQSTTEKKMYLTGGIGSDPSIEGFGADYDLSLDTAYAETCASIGLVFWGNRMAALTGDARHVDVLERALYNGVLSGASSDGTHYFYDNPMRSRGDITRNEWFGVACCPPNFARLVQSLETYAYAEAESTAFVNLFISGSASFALSAGPLRLSVQTRYPWAGTVDVVIDEAPDSPQVLALRVPGWAQSSHLLVNDVPTSPDLSEGYARVERTWTAGDRLRLSLPMTPRLTWSRPEVDASAGRVAIERGPLVYCLEGVDNHGDVAKLSLPDDAVLEDAWDEERRAVNIHVNGVRHHSPEAGLYTGFIDEAEPASITATPYFQWGNRGKSTMEIWIRES